jgi:hypothetical protein
LKRPGSDAATIPPPSCQTQSKSIVSTRRRSAGDVPTPKVLTAKRRLPPSPLSKLDLTG